MPKKNDNSKGNRGGNDGNSVTIKRNSGTNDKNQALRSRFLTPEVKIAFALLKKTFTKAPILHYFELDQYIWIETNTSGYTIRDIFNQLTPKTGQWYLITFFSKKIILAKT